MDDAILSTQCHRGQLVQNSRSGLEAINGRTQYVVCSTKQRMDKRQPDDINTVTFSEETSAVTCSQEVLL